MFRLWKRRFSTHSNRGGSTWRKTINFFSDLPSYIFQICLGYGVRMKNLAMTTIFVLLAFTIINWLARFELGFTEMKYTKIEDIWDALYFSIVVMTTVGFGDIVPHSAIGKVFVSFQAITGFFLFATFASMMFRRFSQ
nr:ion channel [Mesorhizobium loti]